MNNNPRSYVNGVISLYMLASLIKKGWTFGHEQTSDILDDALNSRINQIINGVTTLDRDDILNQKDSFGTKLAKVFDNRAVDRFYAAERFANNEAVTAWDVALAVDYWLQYKKDNVKEHRILMKYDDAAKQYSFANVFVDNNRELHLIDLLRRGCYNYNSQGTVNLNLDGVIWNYSDYKVLPKYRGNFTDTWTNLLLKSRPFYKDGDVSSFTTIREERWDNLNHIPQALVLNEA